jgi:hypothetical protein
VCDRSWRNLSLAFYCRIPPITACSSDRFPGAANCRVLLQASPSSIAQRTASTTLHPQPEFDEQFQLVPTAVCAYVAAYIPRKPCKRMIFLRNFAQRRLRWLVTIEAVCGWFGVL